jgi:hypothetical protein
MEFNGVNRLSIKDLPSESEATTLITSHVETDRSSTNRGS